MYAAVVFRKLLGGHKHDKEPRRMVYTWYTAKNLVLFAAAMCVKGQPLLEEALFHHIGTSL